MNNTNNALETLVQRDKQIKKTNDKLKASINELDAELETTTNALSNHASNTNIHTSKEELIQLIVDHLESLDLGITKEVVSELPTENISDNTLYFVPNDKGSRDEYLYINDKWELVGSTETNFTDYYTKQETATLLESKANSEHSHVVSDITDFPTIPTKTSQLINDSGFLTGSNGLITSVSWNDITNKPNFSDIAISGSYNDLSNKPTIPNVYNKTLTIQKNGTNVATFTSNSNTDVTADITVPTKVSELSNDSGFITGISWDKVTNKPTLATVAISGSYTDLSNTPTIPTKVSQLENDMGFGTGGDTSDCVHKTGNETIAGNKTFTNQLYLGGGGTSYGIISAKDNNSTLRLFGGASVVTGANLDLYGEGLESGKFSLRARTRDKVIGLDGKTDGTLTWNGKNIAIDENLVHTSGAETIDGTKKFTSDLVRKYTAVDITTTPTSDMYAHINFTDKNDKSVAYIQYAQRSNGVDYIGLRVRDKNSNTWGVQLNTNKEFVPLENNTYSLGSSSAKWKNVYATTFNGNLSGTIASSTTATTQATTDNSTKIATTAWVRTYVNSVAGSNTVGSSVSAYWSNSSNVTATGQASSGGRYPECYSDYVTKTPTVGTIYSGAQLYTVLNTYASATGNTTGTSSGYIYYTNNKAQATFSNPISATGKYLCTTANTVKFRAYTATGSSSAVGSSSVVDKSSTKSIFIRVE